MGQYAQPSHAQVGAPRPDMAAYPPASRPMEYPPVPRAHEYPPAGATAPGMPAGVAPMAVPAAAPAPAGGGGFEVPAQDTVTEAVRQRVMAMSEAEIANLEPALREKVLLIRAMHGQAGAA